MDGHGQKRQRFLYKLDWTCPECGAENTHKFDKHRYLSYPEWGEPTEVYLSCDKCETEEVKTVEVVPDLQLRLADQ